jgi:O-antigen ligase
MSTLQVTAGESAYPTFFWIPVGFAIARFGAVEPVDWYWSLAGIAVAAGLCRTGDPAPGRVVRWGLAALLVYAGVQVPAVSLWPAATLAQLSVLAGCVLVFAGAHALVCRRRGRAWALALPLVLVACAEAALGLVQTFATAGGFARGTYVHRNHFAGLMEMALPFAVVYGFQGVVARAGRRVRLTAVAALAGATLLAGAAACSLSRSGFVAALASLAVVGFAAAWRTDRTGRLLIGAAAAGAVLTLAVLLPPQALAERFHRTVDASGSLTDVRPRIWSDTRRLIAAYPLFGCGLGAFETGLHPYRTAALEVRMDYAHNDYLQTVAELGVVGSAIVAVLIGAVARDVVRAVRRSRQPGLALAAAGALAAMALHSATDFNLHIPANALTAAWIAGIASGLAAAVGQDSNAEEIA